MNLGEDSSAHGNDFLLVLLIYGLVIGVPALIGITLGLIF